MGRVEKPSSGPLRPPWRRSAVQPGGGVSGAGGHVIILEEYQHLQDRREER